MNVAITIDLEHDCPPFLTTYRGVEEGVPRLLELFAAEAVPATFFCTGDVARRYPRTVEALVQGGHELGCHGDSHRRFSAMTEAEARAEIEAASETLRRHYPASSFRAPNLDLPVRFVPLLAAARYRLDSSQGRHKQGSYLVRPHTQDGVRRVPASISPSPLRTPAPVRNALCRLLGALGDPAVLFFHPWEFVDMTKTPIPWDCRVRTGEPAVHHLRETLRYFKSRGARFLRMQDLADERAAA